MLEAIFWFLGGALSYKIMSKLLGVSKLIIMYTELHMCLLLAFKMADDNLVMTNKLKDEISDDLQGKGLENFNGFFDEDALNVWRNLVIMNIITLTPKYFRGLIKYQNWNEAMLYLRRTSKNVKFK